MRKTILETSEYRGYQYQIIEISEPIIIENEASIIDEFFPKKWVNGYVALSKGHKHHGKEYNEIPVIVHGGLTYSEYDDNENWVIGFDTTHEGDDQRTQNKEYVLEQIKKLIDQL